MSSKRHSRVPRVLCSPLPSPQHPSLIGEEESAHLHQVLRLRNGDPVIALDGRGAEVRGSLAYRDKGAWIETSHPQPDRSVLIHQESSPLVLEVAILKGDAMSWVIEKAVELGVRRLVPVECDHGVVEVGKKGTQHFVERWQRIADQALKQCERLHRMKVDEPRSLGALLTEKVAERWVALEPSTGFSEAQAFELKGDQEVHVLIGPEGGWSQSECDAFRAEMRLGKLKPAQLGPLVLRAETAAIFVMSTALSGLCLTLPRKQVTTNA